MIRVNYPNRRLGMRHAKADPVIGEWGDMSEMSLGSVALANAREGDIIPDAGVVASITEHTLTLRDDTGDIRRLRSGSPALDKLARECGDRILLRNIANASTGHLIEMLERDPACVRKEWAIMLIDFHHFTFCVDIAS